MLPYNPDMMFVAVEERQRAVRAQMRLAQAGITPYNPIRHLLGRVLIWSGERLGGKGLPPAPALPSSPVIVLAEQRARAELDRAA